MTKTQKIINFFVDNEEMFNDCIESLDSYNGYLDGNRMFDMWELDEFFTTEGATSILLRAFNGYDEDGGAFNPNNNYFRFNGYDNLVSAYSKDYTDYLDDDFVDAIIENQNHIYIPNEVRAIIEEE